MKFVVMLSQTTTAAVLVEAGSLDEAYSILNREEAARLFDAGPKVCDSVRLGKAEEWIPGVTQWPLTIRSY